MNTNQWNRVRYTLMSPIYDLITAGFDQDRRRSIELLELQPGEHVLLLGCGSGSDMNHLPKTVSVTAVDITPAMIEQTRQRAAHLGLAVNAQVMDGQALQLPDAEFDAVILHLVLAVIPDPYACIREAARVVKLNGRVTVMDKFLADDETPSLARRTLNGLTNFAFSDINRRLGDIMRDVPLRKVQQENARFLPRAGYIITQFRRA